MTPAPRFAFLACTLILAGFQSVSSQPKRTATDSPPELVLQSSHAWRTEQVEFSHDGRLIATSSGSRGDGSVKLWEVLTGRQLRTLLGHVGGVSAIAFSPDGRWLASGGEDDTILIFDVVTGAEVRHFYVPAQGVRFLQFSRDGSHLLSLPGFAPDIGRNRMPTDALDKCPDVKGKPGFCEARDLSVWDVAGGRFLFNIPPPIKPCSGKPADCVSTSRLWHVTFTADSKQLAVGVDENEMQLWDVASGKQRPVPKDSTAPFVLAADSRRIASSSLNGEVLIWDLETARVLTTIRDRVRPKAFADQDSLLITQSGERGNELIQTWSTLNGQAIDKLRLDPKYDCANCALDFSADGRWMVRGGFGEPKLFLWDLSSPEKPPLAWLNLGGPIAFSDDGRWLSAVTDPFFNQELPANSIWLLDLKAGAESCASAGTLRRVRAVAVS